MKKTYEIYQRSTRDADGNPSESLVIDINNTTLFDASMDEDDAIWLTAMALTPLRTVYLAMKARNLTEQNYIEWLLDAVAVTLNMHTKERPLPQHEENFMQMFNHEADGTNVQHSNNV